MQDMNQPFHHLGGDKQKSKRINIQMETKVERTFIGMENIAVKYRSMKLFKYDHKQEDPNSIKFFLGLLEYQLIQRVLDKNIYSGRIYNHIKKSLKCGDTQNESS